MWRGSFSNSSLGLLAWSTTEVSSYLMQCSYNCRLLQYPFLKGISVLLHPGLQSPHSLPNVDLTGNLVHNLGLLSTGSVSFTLVNTKWRIRLDLKITFIPNFLQTHLISLLTPATYRIAGKFGEDFNLAIWRIGKKITKLNSRQ